MSGLDALRRGWCPGALRPMQTGDGLLVRLRIPVESFTSEIATALGEAAERFGNGLIDLSSRANLQIRSVRPETLAGLHQLLASLGLLDDDPAAEAVRNVLVSPLAGIDPSLAFDPRPIAAALDARLAGEADLHALPPKIAIVVDGGGRLPLDGVTADLRVLAAAGGQVEICAGGFSLGSHAAGDAAAEVVRVLRVFLDERRPDERRLALFAARLAAEGREIAGARLRPDRRSGAPASAASLAGAIALQGEDAALAAGLPFGRMTGRQLVALSRIAAELGVGLRLTPWRAVLLAPVRGGGMPDGLRAVAKTGLLTDPQDPRLAVLACTGRPACAGGYADVRADAERLLPVLAPWIGRGARVHLSGCAKGCASRAPHTVTLTAGPGGYGLGFDAAVQEPAVGRPLPAIAAELAGLDPGPPPLLSTATAEKAPLAQSRAQSVAQPLAQSPVHA